MKSTLINRADAFIRVLLVVCLSLTAAACSKPAKKAGASPSRPAPLVATAVVSTESIQHRSQRTGTLRANSTVRIFNQEEGRLTELPFYAGDEIKKGDVLLRIDDSLLRAELDKATATLRQAQLDLKQATRLRKKRLVAEDELSRARTAVDVASAELRLLQTRANLTTIRAPISGLVSERLVEPGDVAPRHTHLMTLIDTKTLITEVAISELLLPSLSVGDKVNVNIDALGEQQFTGHILRIHPTLNASTRNGIIEIVLDPAPSGARPGQFCRVDLTSPAVMRRLIPFSALRRDNNGEYVFALYQEGKKQKVSRKSVRSGLRIDDKIEILDGLTDGEKVIVRGFLGLREGKAVRTNAKTATKTSELN